MRHTRRSRIAVVVAGLLVAAGMIRNAAAAPLEDSVVFNDPNSADSQFFICFAPAPFLDGKYTVWGKVVSGMEFIDQIKKGEPPRNPDKIIKMQVAADAEKKS